MIRIGIVEDELLFRLGLKELLSLQQDYEVVGEAADGAAAPRLVAEMPLDLLLLDLRLPGESGAEIVRELRAAGHTVPILLISTFDDDTFLPVCVTAPMASCAKTSASPNSKPRLPRCCAANDT